MTSAICQAAKLETPRAPILPSGDELGDGAEGLVQRRDPVRLVQVEQVDAGRCPAGAGCPPRCRAAPAADSGGARRRRGCGMPGLGGQDDLGRGGPSAARRGSPRSRRRRSRWRCRCAVMPASSASSTMRRARGGVGGVAERHGAQDQLESSLASRRASGMLMVDSSDALTGGCSGTMVSGLRRSAPATTVPRLAAVHGGRIEGGAAQRAGVVLGRARQHLCGRSGLDDRSPRCMHDHLLADLPHHAEVVRDEEVGDAGVVLDARQQVAAPGPARRRPARWSPRRRPAVRARTPAPGDADPLPLPAGELCRRRCQRAWPAARPGRSAARPLLAPVGGAVRPGAAAARRRSAARSGAGRASRTGPGRPSGSCAAAGRSSSLAELVRGPCRRASIRPRGGLEQPHQRLGDGRLAAAGLPDDGERLALVDREADTSSTARKAPPCDRVLDDEVLDDEERLAHGWLRSWSGAAVRPRSR